MPASRAVLGFSSLVLVAASCLFVLFVVLGGAVQHGPVNRLYFLQADTSNIAGAPDVSRWTLWNACGINSDGKDDCSGVHPAYPLDPPRNFGSTDNIPSGFLGTHKYYLLTRFMFAFILIGLFFAAISLILGLLALCSKIVAYLDSALVAVALFFQTLAAALMTAAYVKARDEFMSAGRDANLGHYDFGWMWGSVAALFIATVFLCAGGAVGGSGSTSARRGGFGSFGRKKSTRRDRGSFIDRSSFEKSDRPLPLTNGA